VKIKPTPARDDTPHAHSDFYAEYLQSDLWARVRTAALRRAGYRCSACGASRNLEVHHRTYERLGGEAWADLVVLCHGCHLAADRRREVMGMTRRLKAAREATR
jgi:5-methylcytosine-specific restriction endonuclease McrA